jgi:RND family efflux transporter MFP subunit
VNTELYSGRTFTGKVITIGSQADAAHTYEVEVLVKNSSTHPLKAGMYGQVVLKNTQGAPTLAIPRTALIGSEKNPAVYVVENGIARLRKITTGSKSGDYLSVLSGLQAGEQVVVNGQINLTDSTAVAIAR